ncbi:hypothetical protein, partial [Neisseria lactamica]|uniref:hypothetical protein n=1 Tax=Neisseria lactamica TaxID=486 RepID=UPI0005A9BE47
ACSSVIVILGFVVAILSVHQKIKVMLSKVHHFIKIDVADRAGLCPDPLSEGVRHVAGGGA